MQNAARQIRGPAAASLFWSALALPCNVRISVFNFRADADGGFSILCRLHFQFKPAREIDLESNRVLIRFSAHRRADTDTARNILRCANREAARPGVEVKRVDTQRLARLAGQVRAAMTGQRGDSGGAIWRASKSDVEAYVPVLMALHKTMQPALRKRALQSEHHAVHLFIAWLAEHPAQMNGKAMVRQRLACTSDENGQNTDFRIG